MFGNSRQKKSDGNTKTTVLINKQPLPIEFLALEYHLIFRNIKIVTHLKWIETTQPLNVLMMMNYVVLFFFRSDSLKLSCSRWIYIVLR